jgi:hypothetical protein
MNGELKVLVAVFKKIDSDIHSIQTSENYYDAQSEIGFSPNKSKDIINSPRRMNADISDYEDSDDVF